MYEDDQNYLWKYNYIQTLFTSVLLFSAFMLLLEDLITVWHRWRFNQAKIKSLNNYGYSNSKKNGPKYWKRLFPCCDGKYQSPINIETSLATCVYGCEPLKWMNLERTPQTMMLANTGSNVVLLGSWYCDKQLSISGGSLEQSSYTFKAAYFRWGAKNDEGSEHMIDSTRYPLEIQLRFIDRSNNDEVFIALFCKISPNENPQLKPIVDSLRDITSPCTSTVITLLFDCLQLPFFYGYYTYPGSFTFPPCCEKVTWIVNPQPINISSAQVEKFRQLRNTDGCILTNSRPVQSLRSRTVLFYDGSSEYTCNRNCK